MEAGFKSLCTFLGITNPSANWWTVFRWFSSELVATSEGVAALELALEHASASVFRNAWIVLREDEQSVLRPAILRAFTTFAIGSSPAQRKDLLATFGDCGELYDALVQRLHDECPDFRQTLLALVAPEHPLVQSMASDLVGSPDVGVEERIVFLRMRAETIGSKDLVEQTIMSIFVRSELTFSQLLKTFDGLAACHLGGDRALRSRIEIALLERGYSLAFTIPEQIELYTRAKLTAYWYPVLVRLSRTIGELFIDDDPGQDRASDELLWSIVEALPVYHHQRGAAFGNIIGRMDVRTSIGTLEKLIECASTNPDFVGYKAGLVERLRRCFMG